MIILKPHRTGGGIRVLAFLSLSAGIAAMSACVELTSSGEGTPPTVRFARDTIMTDSGSVRIAGHIVDDISVGRVTYSYAAGPEHEIAVARGNRVAFDANVSVREGFHPLRVFATDLNGNRGWADMLIGATSARLNAAILDYTEADEVGTRVYRMHVRGTAPGMVRLEYHADSGFGRVHRGEIPLGDDPERSFDAVLQPPSYLLGLVAYDSNGVSLSTYAFHHGGHTRLNVSPPAAKRFVEPSVDRVDLHLTGDAWPGDVIESVAVIGGGGDTTNIEVPAEEEVSFDWSPRLTEDMTRVHVRLQTRDGHVGIFSFPLVRVAPPEAAGPFARVSAFSKHTCAVTVEDRIYCWGDHDVRELPAPFEPSFVPVRAFTEWPFVQLFASWSHGCGLDRDGAAYCWGNNDLGQLGDGTTESRGRPSPVTGGLRFTRLVLGGGRTCGISLDERAYCWGSTQNPIIVQYQPTPTEVPGGLRFTEVMIGREESCGVSTDGELFCWKAWTEPTPRRLDVPAKLVEVKSSNRFELCALDDAGDVWCLVDYTPYGGDRNIVRTASGLGLDSLTRDCGLTGDGVTYCWGSGYLSSGEWHWYTPLTPLDTDVRFRSLDAGSHHMCGVTFVGAVYCWGGGVNGQLGNGTQYSLDAPVRVTDPT